jgi:hypothetical protein
MALTTEDKAWFAAELRRALEDALLEVAAAEEAAEPAAPPAPAAVDPAPPTDLGTAGGYDGAIPYVDDLEVGGRARPVRAAEVAPGSRRARIGF